MKEFETRECIRKACKQYPLTMEYRRAITWRGRSISIVPFTPQISRISAFTNIYNLSSSNGYARIIGFQIWTS